MSNTETISFALIGVSVPKEKLFVTRRMKNFEHDYPDNYKVDPITGKTLWTCVHEPIPDLRIDMTWQKKHSFIFSSFVECKTLFGYKVLIFCHQDAYIGIGSTDVGNHERFVKLEFPDNFSSDKLKEEMRVRLEPLGLFDASTFGLWRVV